MVTALLERRIAQSERDTGEQLDFARAILRASRAGFLKFCMFLPLARHRSALPADVYYVGRLVAVMHEDCGPCVQTVINFARRDKVPVAVLRAVVARRPDDLPAELAEVYRFAEAVVAGDPASAALGEALRRQYGEAGMVDLAFGIATGRVFPTVKRVLGYGQSCAVTRFDV